MIYEMMYYAWAFTAVFFLLLLIPVGLIGYGLYRWIKSLKEPTVYRWRMDDDGFVIPPDDRPNERT